MDNNYYRRDGEMRAPATAAETAEAEAEKVLQWGNRKRLRCMKMQKAVRKSERSEPGGSDGRVNRRFVRSDQINRVSSSVKRSSISVEVGKGGNGGSGYINLRQRPSSPPHRIRRNSESSIAMRAQSNGVKGLASPERGGGGGDRRGNNHHHSNGNHQPNNHNNRCNNKNDNNNSNRSSENGNDGKLGSPSASDLIAAAWPPRFEISLTNKEKEEDFLVLKGSKLPQRPKKRAKIIQRTVNLISPGAWLCDLSLERYEVREKKVTKKRPRGLKAMGNNVESDSE